MRGAGLVGKGAAAGAQVSFHPLSCIPCLGGRRELGSMPSAEALRGLYLRQREVPGQQRLTEALQNPFAPLIPWLTSLSESGDPQQKPEQKPARYLVAKGLPTLPTKLVERVWNLEYVEMEDFLPASRSLRMAEQGNPSHSLQDSLVGALNQFQALQKHKSQRRVIDITTWVRCFTLYMAVLSAKARSQHGGPPPGTCCGESVDARKSDNPYNAGYSPVVVAVTAAGGCF